MSIEVNGVSLPDIPSEVLEQYPYAVITHQIYPTANIETYALAVFSEAVHFFSEGSTLNPLDGACNGASFSLGEDGTGTAWTLDNAVENEAVNLPIMSEDYMTIAIVAANYDILTVDAEGNATDTVYFAANFFVSDPNYFAPKSWFCGMARQVMRLTGTSDKLNTDKMLELAKGVEAGKQGFVIISGETKNKSVAVLAAAEVIITEE